MCYLKMKCFNCGAEYELHFMDASACKCPHCLAQLPEKAYRKMRDALYTVEEVNKDFRKAHTEQGRPLFQVEVRNHYVPNEKFNV